MAEANLDTDERPAKRLRPNYSDTITVYVGEDEQKFSVHEALICAKSPFFKAACGLNWQEGQQRVVRLCGRQAAPFLIYVCWVYTDKLDKVLMRKRVDANKVCKTGPPAEHPCILAYAKTWVLANYLHDNVFANLIIDGLRGKFEARPEAMVVVNPTLDYIWEHTVPDSGLRQLCIDHLMRTAPKSISPQLGRSP
ncbi:hypothetical protein BAUCODRAFT_155354 [Baudoinia panamericana UAMH 10762]|uniref:BTB domain-containing protein n=1 Tax=Baudoinia panamericana (strain UAMH 10762) TaxID=717646 RepID=M2NFU2_BAUPA|nr:uncharacterized protein BAUCODRAFT_155354 [Baudoinia panamericana UAMH 10762]EMC98134.1 hypothetical protein BAUCODRAFT_155354 [Baudoinia panamericana UAMH 10762]